MLLMLIQVQQKERQEVAEKSRSDYKLGVGKIDDWLNQVEGLLEKETPCQSQALMNLYEDLEVSKLTLVWLCHRYSRVALQRTPCTTYPPL